MSPSIRSSTFDSIDIAPTSSHSFRATRVFGDFFGLRVVVCVLVSGDASAYGLQEYENLALLSYAELRPAPLRAHDDAAGV